MSNNALTLEQQSDFNYVLSLMKDGENFRLDLSDERQYRHAVAMHTLAGQTPERYPGLHAALALARDYHREHGVSAEANATDIPLDDVWQSGGVVTAVGKDQNNLAGSEGYVTMIGGVPTLNGLIIVADANGNWLAQGSQSNYNDGTYMGMKTNPGIGTATSTMTGYIQYTYQQVVGGPTVTQVVQRQIQLGVFADPNVTEPVQVRTTGPAIRIGLGRGPVDQNKNDVDYWFWQGTNNTQYAVPLVGNVAFTANMVTPLVPNSNFFVSGKLARKGDGGFKPIPAAALTNIYNNCQPSTPNTLTWKLPSGDKQNPNDPPPPATNPIIFGDINWASEIWTYFYIQFSVRLQGQVLPAVAIITSSDQPDTDPLDGVKNIKPLQFVYHCLAEGTKITLADGSKRNIEDLTGKHSVRGGGPETELPVTSTNVAHHRGKVLQLTIGQGRHSHKLTLSHNHVVMTPFGPRTAKSLEVGGVVNVEGGTALITKKAEKEFDGLLCNISVSDYNSPADPVRNSMFANGVQVCDYEVQVQHEHEHRQKKEVVLQAIDPMFHQDYLNYLEDQAAAKAAS